MKLLVAAILSMGLIVLLKSRENAAIRKDPILALRGSGRHLWAHQHADDFVKSLRADWE